MRRPFSLVMLLVVVAATMAAGCGGGGAGARARRTATATPAAAASVAASATPSAPRAVPWRTLRFRASDGVRLRGRFTPAARANAPAIVLVHQLNGGPWQWNPLVPYLHRAGYATLAYRSRSAHTLAETHLVRDLIGAVAAVRRQRGVDPHRIGLVGGSIGATTIAWYLGRSPAPAVRAGVGLSPVERAALINAGLTGRFHPRDLLLIADRNEIGDSQEIWTDANGHGVRTWIAPVTGHGIQLLPAAPVRARLLGWLRAHLSTPNRTNR